MTGGPWQGPLSVALGLAAYVLSNLGMGVQKAGASAVQGGSGRRGLVTWVQGTCMTVTGALLLFPALALGRASVITPLEGVGLAALAVYASRRLGEHLGTRERWALALIGLGTALVGFFGTGAPAPGEALRAGALVLATAGVLGIAFALAGGAFLASRRGVRSLAGPGLGCSAGSMAGLAMIFQKVLGETLLGSPGDLLSDARILAFLGAAGAGFLLLQAAYLHGRAVDVVPSYAGAAILVPTGTAAFIFGEPMPAEVLAGVAMVVAGVVLLADPASSLEGRSRK